MQYCVIPDVHVRYHFERALHAKMMSQALILETKHSHGVVQLTLNRPQALNALNTTLYKQLSQALAQHNKARTTRLIVLTGAGKHFCGGMDVKEALCGKTEARGIVRAAHEFMQTLLRMDKPVIVAAFGAVTGIGVTMLMHCDVVVVAEESEFRTPFVQAGIVAEFASSVLFERKLGGRLCRRMLMMGESVGAREMERVGVCEVVGRGAEEVIRKGVEIGEKWSGGMRDEEWESVIISKRLMREGMEGVVERAMERELRAIEERIEKGSALRGMQRRMAEMGRKAKM